MKLLVLTDHQKHSDRNSLYALLESLAGDERIAAIRLASRGTKANAGFFQTMDSLELWTLEMYPGLDRESAAVRFEDQESLQLLDPHWADAVLMRIPHPMPEPWLLWLHVKLGHLPMINHPLGIRKSSSKAYLMEHEDWCAPICLCEKREELMSFVFPKGQQAATRNVVLKPLYGYGGKDILRIMDGQVELPDAKLPLAEWLQQQSEPLAYLAMEYLWRVQEGDKRIVVMDGKIIGSVMRYPAKGQWLCNVSQGGKAGPAKISQRERDMIEAINPKLQAIGVHFYGIDTLKDDAGRRVLSELNTMSVGGLLDLPALEGRSAVEVVARRLVDIFQSQRSMQMLES